MFEYLAEFDKILVTGPQRSGTRICTKMIAYDTGHEYVDELGIVGDSINWLGTFVQSRQRFVVQCPALCRHIHMFSADDTAIVLMRREVGDIIASQERVGWRGEWLELARYDRTDGVIAEIKYRFWDEVQKGRIEHGFEVKYEHLAEHPLWVAKPLRQEFKIGQTAVMGADLPENARLQSYSDVLYETNLDQIVAIISKRGPTKLLNATGRMIWNLCDGTCSRQDILRVLKAQFGDVEEEALARDLDEFLAELIKLRFLWYSADAEGANDQVYGE
jgi:hypothetical protein